MGAEYDAYITVDRLGAPRCAGGVCTTTRDLARVGQLLADGGRHGDRQVVPEAWIEDILTKGDRSAWDRGDFIDYFPGMPIHYRSKWYVLDGTAPIAFGLGVHGQNVFIDRANSIVIAKFSSQVQALDAERIAATMAAVEAIRGRLIG
jgi:CubicO group peptidase (beta-lactamase class C family)